MSGQSSSQWRQLLTKRRSGNKCSDVPTKIQLRVTRWIIGTGRVNSSGLIMSVKHAAALAWQRAFRKQSSLFEVLFYLYFVFLMYPFFFKIVHYYDDKTESLSTKCLSNKVFSFIPICLLVVFAISQNFYSMMIIGAWSIMILMHPINDTTYLWVNRMVSRKAGRRVDCKLWPG